MGNYKEMTTRKFEVVTNFPVMDIISHDDINKAFADDFPNFMTGFSVAWQMMYSVNEVEPSVNFWYPKIESVKITIRDKCDLFLITVVCESNFVCRKLVDKNPSLFSDQQFESILHSAIFSFSSLFCANNLP